MKIIDLQPRQVVAILEVPLDELRSIADSLEGAIINERGGDVLKEFSAMVNKLLDEFDHGITPNGK